VRQQLQEPDAKGRQTFREVAVVWESAGFWYDTIRLLTNDRFDQSRPIREIGVERRFGNAGRRDHRVEGNAVRAAFQKKRTR